MQTSLLVRSIAAAKRTMPFQGIGSGICNIAGRTIKATVNPKYNIGGYRYQADEYNLVLEQVTYLSRDIIKGARTGKDLVSVPENPYFRFGREFFKDETLALAFGIGVAAATNYILDFIYQGYCPRGVKAGVLAVIQPLTEKPSLVFRHIRKAYNNAYPDERRSPLQLLEILKEGIRNGWQTLRADLLFHDPFSVINMGTLSYMFQPSSGLQAGMLQGVSFVLAVLQATLFEIQTVDIMYRLKCRDLSSLGFEANRFFETRYLLNAGVEKNDPVDVLDWIAGAFELIPKGAVRHHDSYIKKAQVGEYNAMVPSVRFREAEQNSAQVIFTRASEVSRGRVSPYKCFVIAKQKFTSRFAGERMVWEAGEIPDTKVARTMKKMDSGARRHDVIFWRFEIGDSKGHTVTIDIPDASEVAPDLSIYDGPYWIEVKVKDDLEYLVRMNEFILREFEVDPTTKTKFELTSSDES